MAKNKYMIYLDDSKTGISVEKYLLNKEVFCIKTVSDVDLGAILSAYSTILITGVECEEVRNDCHYIAIRFKDFTGESKEVKIYIDGGEYSLPAFVKTTFFPVQSIVTMKDVINSLPNLKDWDFNIRNEANNSKYNYNDTEKRAYCRGFRDCFNFIHKKINGEKAF
jgi:hypothetical protein